MFLVAGVECLYSAVEARRVVRWTAQPVWVRRAPASRRPLVLRRRRLPIHRLSLVGLLVGCGCELLCVVSCCASLRPGELNRTCVKQQGECVCTTFGQKYGTALRKTRFNVQSTCRKEALFCGTNEQKERAGTGEDLA